MRNAQNVKSTMIEALLTYLAPHLCYGCSKTGILLCDNCKYNITSEYTTTCILCSRPSEHTGVCGGCHAPYSRAWYVGERSGELRELIDGYKFERVRAAYRPLADLLLECVDQLPSNTVVVPVPTIAPHVRQRGYDHMRLIAHYFARKRKLKLDPVLKRATATRQRDASRSQRMKQAQSAFRITQRLAPDTPYLLIDDIITTGATLQYATQALQEAGATTVWVAAIARQPLD